MTFVSRVFDYYKRQGYSTQVMGASFRTAEQILALAGCDFLTCSPTLLSELAARDEDVSRRLVAPDGREAQPRHHRLDETAFRWRFNEDPMAVEKLAEGIRIFDADARRLEEYAGFGARGRGDEREG